MIDTNIESTKYLESMKEIREENKEIIQRINNKVDECLSILNNINWKKEGRNDIQLHTKNRRRILTSY